MTLTVSVFDVLLVMLLSVHEQATAALLLRLAAAVPATLTLSVTSELAPAAMGVAALMQVTSWPVALHAQPVPAPLTNVKPAGSVSVTVIVPLLAANGALLTVSVYCAPCWPCVKLVPTCALLIVKSGNEVTATLSTFDTLFAVLLSAQEQATAAELLMVAAALLDTFTSSVITDVPLARIVVAGLLQVTSCATALHVHPVPAPLAKLKPAGSVSVTVMVPLASAVDALVTVNVYCAPCCPCVKFAPMCALLIVRSGNTKFVMANATVPAPGAAAFIEYVPACPFAVSGGATATPSASVFDTADRVPVLGNAAAAPALGFTVQVTPIPAVGGDVVTLNGSANAWFSGVL